MQFENRGTKTCTQSWSVKWFILGQSFLSFVKIFNNDAKHSWPWLFFGLCRQWRLSIQFLAHLRRKVGDDTRTCLERSGTRPVHQLWNWSVLRLNNEIFTYYNNLAYWTKTDAIFSSACFRSSMPCCDTETAEKKQNKCVLMKWWRLPSLNQAEDVG